MERSKRHGEEKAKLLDQLEAEKVKEIIELLKVIDGTGEVSDAKEEGEKKEEEHELSNWIRVKVGELIEIAVIKWKAVELEESDLSVSFSDDFSGVFKVKDHNDDFTEEGQKLERILNNTLKKVRACMENKLSSVPTPKKEKEKGK